MLASFDLSGLCLLFLKILTKFSACLTDNFFSKILFATKEANIMQLEMSIVNKIGLNVEIKNKKNNKGKITFEYKDLDQLNKIIEIIKSNY